MNDRPESDADAGDQPELPVRKPARKPWHAPRFVVAGLASTDAVSNAGADGATSAPSLS
jgi:hypothetical protein